MSLGKQQGRSASGVCGPCHTMPVLFPSRTAVCLSVFEDDPSHQVRQVIGTQQPSPSGFRSRKVPIMSLPKIPFRLTCLEEVAYTFLCPGRLWTEDCSDSLIKHCLEATLRQSRAFEVFHRVCWEESRCCNVEEGNRGRQWGVL